MQVFAVQAKRLADSQPSARQQRDQKPVGELIVQGEDLGAWINAQQVGWEQLAPAQRFLLETVGVEPAGAGETAAPGRRSQDQRWATHLTAARQSAREGHLHVPRKHTETIRPGGDGKDDQGAVVKLGAWIDNTRRRAAKLSHQRRADLDELGMRW
ncbi:helicase associated domain-containing protein [Streptomyces sp. C1-1]|uniref:helicase associated domain-containing protein n=1 Tax=Streptomyces sp. C1-1 TaxID=3231173 RepID=UPI003D088663